MSMLHDATDKAFGTLAFSAGAVTVGVSIAEVNQYLQAGAFIVAIISGLAATVYYLRKHKK
jgi:hypothetical protein